MRSRLSGLPTTSEKIMKIADFRSLASGPDFLGHRFLIGKRRDSRRSKRQKLEIILGNLRHYADRQNRFLAEADLEPDVDALLVSDVGADRIRGETVIGEVPVLVPIKPKAQHVIRL